MRRFGKPPLEKQYYSPRPGVYAILPRNGQLLLTFQEEPKPEVQLPGGGIDPGESPLSALNREVFEETGWKIANPRRLGCFRRYAYMPEYDKWADKVCIVYIALPVRALGPPAELSHTAIWADPEFAMKNVGNPGDSFFVKTLFGLI